MKTTTAKKWGNSIAVRLPAKVARRFGIRDGSPVQIVEESKTHSFSIRPAHEHEYTLEYLLSQVTAKNRHEVIEWGAPQGKEVW